MCLPKCSSEKERERERHCLYYSFFFFSNSELFHKHARQERMREMASLSRFVLAHGQSLVWHSSFLLSRRCKRRRDRIFQACRRCRRRRRLTSIFFLCAARRREEQKTAKKKASACSHTDTSGTKREAPACSIHSGEQARECKWPCMHVGRMRDVVVVRRRKGWGRERERETSRERERARAR